MLRTIVLSLLLLVGCSEETEDYVFLGGEARCYYDISHAEEHRFVDYQGLPYNMSVEYEVAEDADDLSAYEVAAIAAQTVFVHRLMGLVNNGETYEMLSSGHWVVLDNEDFKEVLVESTEKLDPDKTGAAIWIDPNMPCYETKEIPNWSSIIRRGFWDRDSANVVVHEMMHVVSLATFGDSDSKHENKALWIKYGQKTLQARVLYMHENQIFYF